METAAREIAALKFGNCGQICVAPNRIFVHEAVYSRFRELFLEHARAVRVGFGRENQPTMGPLIDEAARCRVMGMVEDAVAKGRRILHGGKIPAHLPAGWFYEPTVLENVDARACACSARRSSVRWRR